jgi:uncharacterized DUF497 family protein
MRITFDPAKREATLRDRQVDFLDAELVFEGPKFMFPDERFAYPEPRFVTIGVLADRMVVVVWTPIEDGCRVMSMRRANDREKARYSHRLG